MQRWAWLHLRNPNPCRIMGAGQAGRGGANLLLKQDAKGLMRLSRSLRASRIDQE
jgi:hypothetical protein